MKKLLIFVLFSLSSIVLAQQPPFIDFDFRVKSHSLRSPEINTVLYLTPNRNLIITEFDISIYGALSTTDPTQPTPQRVYKDLFIGETVSVILPLLISNTDHNFINIVAYSIDKKLNRKVDKFSFKITSSLNKIKILKQ
jgi:hypothetical protein